eukprot:135950-Prymnesium_polylepis.1
MARPREFVSWPVPTEHSTHYRRTGTRGRGATPTRTTARASSLAAAGDMEHPWSRGFSGGSGRAASSEGGSRTVVFTFRASHTPQNAPKRPKTSLPPTYEWA